MFRRLVQLAAVAAVAALPFAMAGGASASASHPAAPAVAPPCAAGFSPITNQAGGAIAGTGVNNPVNLQSTGNCFHAENPVTVSGGTAYEYVNGDNHCLWVNANTLEVGANDCISGHVNEEIVGELFISGQGWALQSVANGNFLQPNVCGSIGTKVTTQASIGSCPRWTV
jgi:hypothetical protein